jgi:Family of unknown function (DUF5706)
VAENEPPLTSDQLLRSLETSLARLVTTGAIADSRCGLVISSNIAMLGGLVAALAGTPFARSGPAAWTLVGLTAALCVLSIALAALAAFPRPGSQQGSLLFFGSIAQMRRDEYFARLRASSQVDFARDLADQCHRVSQIAAFKFRWTRRSMIALLFAAVPWLACLEMAGRLRPL